MIWRRRSDKNMTAADRKGGRIVVRFDRESRGPEAGVLTEKGEDVVELKGDLLLFQGKSFQPCDWLDGTQFYVTFCQF